MLGFVPQCQPTDRVLCEQVDACEGGWSGVIHRDFDQIFTLNLFYADERCVFYHDKNG